MRVQPQPMRLLVVEDEPKVAKSLREGLESEGYEVVVEGTGDAGFRRGHTERFDLILLDLGLPGMGGLEILTALREEGVETPVLVLTARDAVGDRVNGLNTGADDYLVKPFAFSELLARIRAVSRRGRMTAPRRLIVGDLEIDLTTRQVRRGERKVELTAKEFELLEHLAGAGPQIVSRDTLAREVWSETSASTTLDNVIDVHISRLRRKIDLDGGPRLLHTVRGVGFVLREDHP